MTTRIACLPPLLVLLAAFVGVRAGISEPQGIHISLSPNETSPGALGVSFSSANLSDDAGVLYWQADQNATCLFAPAKRTSYELPCIIEENPAGCEDGQYSSPHMYHAILDTEPGLEYEYWPVMDRTSIEQEQEKAREEGPYTTTAPPTPSRFGGDATRGAKLGVFGDLGQTNDSIANAYGMMMADGMDMTAILNVGDLAYADPYHNHTKGDDDEPIPPGTVLGHTRWDSYASKHQHMFAQIPTMNLPGNHEIENYQKKKGDDFLPFTAYAHRYPHMMNCEACGGGGYEDEQWKANMWYSFDVGNAHIAMLSDYHDFKSQVKWLDRDLAAVDRSQTPWVIVNVHAPVFNSNNAKSGKKDM